MGKKRKREDAKGKKPTNIQDAMKDTPALSSKLKRIRPGTDEKQKPDEPVASAEDKVNNTEEHISNLKKLINSFLQQFEQSNRTVLPTVDLLTSILDVAAVVPVPHIMRKLDKVPKILFIAVHIGIDEQARSSGIGSLVLIRCLMCFAKGVSVVLPENDDSRKTRRSAFLGDGEQLSRVELETVSKAGKWAIRMLKHCIRGDGERTATNLETESEIALRHADTSSMFVAPRDKVDVVMAKHYVQEINFRLQEYMVNKQVTTADKVAKLQSVCAKIYPMMHQMPFVHIVETIISTASAMEVHLDRTAYPHDLLPARFVSRVLSFDNQEIFLQASLETRAMLLGISENAWSTWFQIVRNNFPVSEYTSVEVQRSSVKVLAMAAATYVELHWKIMDDIRREVSNGSLPFSIRLWKNREFYRVLLEVTCDEIQSACDKSAVMLTRPGACTPLHRRFPPHNAPLIRALSMFTSCIRRQGDLLNYKAGFSGVQCIASELNLKKTYRLSPSMHAVLLCSERAIELLCWASGYGVSKEVSQSNEMSRELEFVLSDLAAICAVLDLIRLPDGQSGEDENITRRRAQELRDVLMSTCVRHKLPTRRSGEWKLNGLMALCICGCCCGREVRSLRKFVSFLGDDERKELRRATEISIEMANDEESCKRLHHMEKELNELSQKKHSQ